MVRRSRNKKLEVIVIADSNYMIKQNAESEYCIVGYKGKINYDVEQFIISTNGYYNNEEVIISEIKIGIDANKLSNSFPNVKVLIVPKGIRICSYAFCDFSNLEEVMLEDEIEELSSTFCNCTKLSKIKLPKNLKIMSGTFSNCESLENVRLSNNLTKIPVWTFQGCSNLSSIYIPDSVTIIDNEAFKSCTNFKKVRFSNNLQKINGGAFYYCSSLISSSLSDTLIKSITIPEKVKKIDNSAFCGCTSIEEIKIPSRVEYMGEYVFQLCSKSLKINVDKYETDCTSWNTKWNNRNYASGVEEKYNVIYKSN